MAEEDFETTRSLRFRTTRFPGFVGVPLSGTEDISIGEGGVRTPQSGLANVSSPEVEGLGVGDMLDPVSAVVGKGPLSGAIKGGLSGYVIGGPGGALVGAAGGATAEAIGGPVGGAVGGAIEGAGIGAFVGGPPGAAIGAGVGAVAGGLGIGGRVICTELFRT